jgi:sugar phosphate permease
LALVFRLPVSLSMVGAAVFWLVARDKPQDLGFPELPRDC